MEVGILGETVYVSSGDQLWLLDPAEDAAERAKELGVTPTATLLTKIAAPGLSDLEKMPVVVRIPLRMGELVAEPVERDHGWDYVVKEVGAEDSLLYTLRGDVSVADVEPHAVAVIGNKYRASAFTDAVITRPWANTASLTVGKHKPGGVSHDQSRHAGSRGGSGAAGEVKDAGEGIRYQVRDDEAQIEMPDHVVANMREGVETQADFYAGDTPETKIIAEELNQLEVRSQGDYSYQDVGALRGVALDQADFYGDYAFEMSDAAASSTAATYNAYADAFDTILTDMDAASKEQHTRHKEWSSLAAVPDRVKKYQGTPLTLSQANHVARIADAAKGQEGVENEWAVAWAQFKQLYSRQDGAWKRERRAKEIEIPEAIVALLSDVKLLPGQFAFKEQEGGVYRWYSLTATDVWDFQDEQIPPEAIDWSLAVSTILKDRGPLLYRHLPLPWGGCDKQVRAGPLLFESGLTDSVDENPVARAAVAVVQKEPGRWSISPGLRFKEGDLVDGKYKRCWIYERSLTHSPANPTASFTLGGTEMKVTQDMLKEAAEELGLDLEQLEALAKTYLDQDKEYENMAEALKEIAAKAAADMSEEEDEERKGRKRGTKGDDEEEEDEETAGAEKELRELIASNTEAMQAVAKALTSMSSQPNAAAKENIREAVEAFLAKVPKAEAADFATTNKSGDQGGDGDPEAVQATLQQMQKQLDKLTAGNGPVLRQFEQMFTSTDLNPSGGAS